MRLLADTVSLGLFQERLTRLRNERAYVARTRMYPRTSTRSVSFQIGLGFTGVRSSVRLRRERARTPLGSWGMID